MGGDVSGNIRVSVGKDLTIRGGRSGEINFAQIGNGSNDDSRNISGTIDIEVGNDLTMQRGSRADLKGDVVRDAYAKIGHGANSIDGGQGDGSGTREGDITVSVGHDLITLNGLNADGSDSGRGPHIGHYQLKNDNVAGGFGSKGDTFIAVSRNDPSPSGLGAFRTSADTVFTSADGGFTTELRLYMPTAVQDGISDGTFLNSAAYTRSPTPGTRFGSDEHLATEHTLGVGPLGSPTGDFTPEGAYPGHTLGLYNIYFGEIVIVTPTTTRTGQTARSGGSDLDTPIILGGQLDAFGRGDFLLSYDGYDDGQLGSMALDDGVDDGSGEASFFERLLDDSVGPRRHSYLEEEENEELERRKSKLSRKTGKMGLTFYVFDPGTNKYSSYSVFGTPRADTGVTQ